MRLAACNIIYRILGQFNVNILSLSRTFNIPCWTPQIGYVLHISTPTTDAAPLGRPPSSPEWTSAAAEKQGEHIQVRVSEQLLLDGMSALAISKAGESQRVRITSGEWGRESTLLPDAPMTRIPISGLLLGRKAPHSQQQQQQQQQGKKNKKGGKNSEGKGDHADSPVLSAILVPPVDAATALGLKRFVVTVGCDVEIPFELLPAAAGGETMQPGRSRQASDPDEPPSAKRRCSSGAWPGTVLNPAGSSASSDMQGGRVSLLHEADAVLSAVCSRLRAVVGGFGAVKIASERASGRWGMGAVTVSSSFEGELLNVAYEGRLLLSQGVRTSPAQSPDAEVEDGEISDVGPKPASEAPMASPATSGWVLRCRWLAHEGALAELCIGSLTAG